jgi:hypothetical protein
MMFVCYSLVLSAFWLAYQSPELCTLVVLGITASIVLR